MRFAPSLETKAAKGATSKAVSPKANMPYGLKGTPYMTNWSAERAVKDGFERDLWVYRSIHTIAAAEARLRIKLVTGDPDDERESTDDPLLKCFNVRANPIESARVFRYRMGCQLMLSKKGVFVELIRSRGGDILELHLLPPDRTNPVPDDEDYVKNYEVWVGGSKAELDPEQVLWIRRPHPLDPYAGSTPMESAGLSIDTDFYARLYNRNFLQNDGRPAGIVGFKGPVDDDELLEIERRYSGGPQQAGRITAVGDLEGMEFMDLAKTPRDMQYKDLRIGTKEEILAAFGVPESQLGNASGRTFDNADAEAVFFWAITMLDHNETILEPFSMLRGEEQDDLHFEHDLSKVEPLQRLKRAEREEDRADVAAGIMTRDEYREKWGQDPTKEAGGESLYVAAGLVPITGPAKAAADKAAADQQKQQADMAKASLEAAKHPDPQADPASDPNAAVTGGEGGASSGAVRGALNPGRAVMSAERGGKVRALPAAAAGKAMPGDFVLIPQAEDWGLHEVKAVSRDEIDGVPVVGLTVVGDLTGGMSETFFYPPNLGLKFSDDQVRDDHGRWTSGGGGGAGLPDAIAAGPASLASLFQRGKVDITASPANVATLGAVLEKLGKGETVELKPGDVNSFLDVLHDKAQSGKDFDLANVAVAGNMIFHGDGPARSEMPQIPNEAKDKFLEEMAAKGVKAQDTDMEATALRPTQREISGAKVTGMMDAVAAGKLNLNDTRIIVSSDGYVLDGHHRWAAAVGRDYEDGKAGDVKIPVTVLDTPMSSLLAEANSFVDREGIGRVGFGAASGDGKKAYPWLFYGAPDYARLERKYSDDQARDDHGRFGSGGGGDTAVGAHAVGVSSDPYSQSLHTLTGPRQPSESEAQYNQRVFENGLERYPPARGIEEEAHDVRAALGLPDPKVQNWTAVEANWDRAQQVGNAFAALKSDPENPEVKAAYAALVDQTKVQWDHLTSPESEGGQGIKVDFVSPDDIREKYGDKEGLNPYPTAEAQRDDLVNNHHLAIASISDYPEAYHPLLSNDRGGEYDTFRAVHDAYGHAAIGADFTRHGEYEAYLHHASMFSGDALRAASTELTGENSFLITHHEPAEHKAALLPDALIASPYDADGNLRIPAQWKGLRLATKGDGKKVGGEAEILAKFGVVQPANALFGKIKRDRDAKAKPKGRGRRGR